MRGLTASKDAVFVVFFNWFSFNEWFPVSLRDRCGWAALFVFARGIDYEIWSLRVRLVLVGEDDDFDKLFGAKFVDLDVAGQELLTSSLTLLLP